MEFLIRSLTVLFLTTLCLAQLEDYGYFGHGVEFYRPAIPHQALDQSGSIDDDDDLDFHAHPKYSYDYSVKDPHTGDDKEHWETRDGDKVKGKYTLTETDGTKRVVEYEADDKNGFNAVVHRIGKPEHPEFKPEYKPEFKPLFKPEYNTEYKPKRPEFLGYHQDFQQYDNGFVPMAVNYRH